MASAIQEPFTVDPATGNISVHGRASCNIPLAFEDLAGNPLDVSAMPLFFEVRGKFRVALAAGAIASERNILLDNAEIKLLGVESPTPFVILDESTTIGGHLYPVPVYEGLITARGFNVQPADGVP